MKIGVLALQGGFAEHIEKLQSLNVKTFEIRKKTDLEIQRSEEHTSGLQSLTNLVCRLLLEIGRASCRERV